MSAVYLFRHANNNDQTHADDSVLLRSPEQPGGPNGGYKQAGGRGT